MCTLKSKGVVIRLGLIIMENKNKILVVDDEAQIRNVLRILLESRGYSVIGVSNGRNAIQKMQSEPDIDLVIMDIMMPKMSGYEATKEIRAFSYVPILFLSAKSMNADKSSAYGFGGDDYIVKPFESTELLMKTDALIRRYRQYHANSDSDTEDTEQYIFGIKINRKQRIVYKDNEPVELRDKEMDILLYLTAHKGETIDVPTLYSAVWNEIPMPSSANTIMVHILNIRRKLEPDPSNPRFIRTIWGKGYQVD